MVTILSEDESVKLRDRLTALEVEVKYVRRDLGAMADEIKSLATSVGGLTEVLQQARGARYVVLAGVAAIGAFSTYIPTLFKLLLAVK